MGAGTLRRPISRRTTALERTAVRVGGRVGTWQTNTPASVAAPPPGQRVLAKHQMPPCQPGTALLPQGSTPTSSWHGPVQRGPESSPEQPVLTEPTHDQNLLKYVSEKGGRLQTIGNV